MQFAQKLAVRREGVYAALALPPAGQGPAAGNHLEAACHAAENTARPRWCSLRLPLEEGAPPADTAALLPGRDAASHLSGCTAAVLLAITLGQGLEAALRRAMAQDVEQGVYLDAAAGVLAEQYAEAAEEALRRAAGEEGLFLTGRFSPGYGDLPLSVQGAWVRLLDAPRKIGLTVNESGLLLPRKSVTALLGLSRRETAGHAAGCDTCHLQNHCTSYRKGEPCAKFHL